MVIKGGIVVANVTFDTTSTLIVLLSCLICALISYIYNVSAFSKILGGVLFEY